MSLTVAVVPAMEITMLLLYQLALFGNPGATKVAGW
jgi:hypothetical protein